VNSQQSTCSDIDKSLFNTAVASLVRGCGCFSNSFITCKANLKLNARIVTHIFIEDLTVTIIDIKCNVEFSLVHLHFLYFLCPPSLDDVVLSIILLVD
jgi:hypothetical protein